MRELILIEILLYGGQFARCFHWLFHLYTNIIRSEHLHHFLQRRKQIVWEIEQLDQVQTESSGSSIRTHVVVLTLPLPYAHPFTLTLFQLRLSFVLLLLNPHASEVLADDSPEAVQVLTLTPRTCLVLQTSVYNGSDHELVSLLYTKNFTQKHLESTIKPNLEISFLSFNRRGSWSSEWLGALTKITQLQPRANFSMWAFPTLPQCLRCAKLCWRKMMSKTVSVPVGLFLILGHEAKLPGTAWSVLSLCSDSGMAGELLTPIPKTSMLQAPCPLNPGPVSIHHVALT